MLQAFTMHLLDKKVQPICLLSSLSLLLPVISILRSVAMKHISKLLHAYQWEAGKSATLQALEPYLKKCCNETHLEAVTCGRLGNRPPWWEIGHLPGVRAGGGHASSHQYLRKCCNETHFQNCYMLNSGRLGNWPPYRRPSRGACVMSGQGALGRARRRQHWTVCLH